MFGEVFLAGPGEVNSQLDHVIQEMEQVFYKK
jgi:hypothetical protein